MTSQLGTSDDSRGVWHDDVKSLNPTCADASHAFTYAHGTHTRTYTQKESINRSQRRARDPPQTQSDGEKC